MIDKVDLHSSFEKKGDWWLPENPSKKIKGRLTFSPEDGALLYLDGMLLDTTRIGNASKEPFEHPRLVLGTIDKDQDVTLIKPVFKKLNLDINEQEFYINKALFGYHLKSEEEAAFNHFRFKINFLEDWFTDRFFKVTTLEQENATIAYNIPKRFEFKNMSPNLTIKNSFCLPCTGSSSTVFIEYKEEIIVETEEKKSMEYFLDYAFSFEQLITFLANERMPLSQAYFVKEERGIPKKTYYLHQPKTHRKETVSNNWHMPFHYLHLEHRFEDVLNRWFSLIKDFREGIDLFIFSFFDGGPFHHSKFLSLAQICEHFAVVTKIKKCGRHKEKIISLFNYLPYEIKNKITNDPGGFFQRCLNTRNYYTHYNENIKDKKFADKDLYWATMKLKWIFMVALYKQLGISDQDIVRRLDHIKDFGYITDKNLETI